MNIQRSLCEKETPDQQYAIFCLLRSRPISAWTAYHLTLALRLLGSETSERETLLTLSCDLILSVQNCPLPCPLRAATFIFLSLPPAACLSSLVPSPVGRCVNQFCYTPPAHPPRQKRKFDGRGGWNKCLNWCFSILTIHQNHCRT